MSQPYCGVDIQYVLVYLDSKLMDYMSEAVKLKEKTSKKEVPTSMVNNERN